MAHAETTAEPAAAAAPEEPGRSARRTRWRPLLLALAILGLGVALAGYFVLTREEPARTEPGPQAVLVEVERVERNPVRLAVEGWGSVRAAQVVQVQPQVSGRLAWINPNLVPGGVIAEGDLLYRIESRDYELAVRQSRSALAEARTQLRLEEGRREVARQEWELFQETFESDRGEVDPALALREPQLESARVAVQSARAQLDRARLDLERTRFRAPLDAYVREEQAEIGALVTPQTVLATLVGTGEFWVQVALPSDRLPAIRVPGERGGAGTEGADAPGSRARVYYELGGRTVEREGEVFRRLGDIEERGRMAQVLVRVEDPLGLAGESGEGVRVRERRASSAEVEAGNDDGAGAGGLADAPLADSGDHDRVGGEGVPLLAGSYVRVVIEGDEVVPLVEVPRAAVQGRDRVYVYANGVLDIRQVEVVWQREDSVLVDAGLADGELVVVSPIPRPVHGMRLRTAPDPSDTGPQPDDSVSRR